MQTFPSEFRVYLTTVAKNTNLKFKATDFNNVLFLTVFPFKIHAIKVIKVIEQ